jgi:cobalt-zinc-cadmium efflux system membrane fusion protein
MPARANDSENTAGARLYCRATIMGPTASRILSVVAVAVSLSACSDRSKAASDAPTVPAAERKGNHVFVPDGSPLRERIAVDTVTTQSIQRQLSAPATVEAEPTRLAKISPPLAGRVVKLFVHFGDAITQGTPLFTLDSPDLVSAQSDYLKATSAFAQAGKTVDRQQDLQQHGIGAQRELEQAQTDRETAKSELDRASMRLRLLGMDPGAVGGPLTVRSPITGRVIDLSTAPGQFQNDPSAILMIVADLTTVWVTANVQEKDLRRVHQGDEANAQFSAYPGEDFAGHVLSVGDLLDPDTRTIKVRVAFDNRDFRLKPGMFATVTFKSTATLEVVVPTSAVVIDGDKSFVFVEVAPFNFERRPVDVGPRQGNLSIINDGLAAGTRIVMSNAILLP